MRRRSKLSTCQMAEEMPLNVERVLDRRLDRNEAHAAGGSALPLVRRTEFARHTIQQSESAYTQFFTNAPVQVRVRVTSPIDHDWVPVKVPLPSAAITPLYFPS
jgi:hypothetical protein